MRHVKLFACLPALVIGVAFFSWEPEILGEPVVPGSGVQADPQKPLFRFGSDCFRPGSEIQGIAVFPHTKQQMVTSGKNGLSLWGIENGDRVDAVGLPLLENGMANPADPLVSPVLSPLATDGKYIFHLINGRVYRYSTELEKPEAFPNLPDRKVAVIVIAPQKGLLAYTTNARFVSPQTRGGKALAWENQLGLFTFGGDKRFVAAGGDYVAFSCDGEVVAVRRTTGGFSPERGELKVAALTALAVSRDGKWMATVDEAPKRKELQIRKVPDLTETATWKCPPTEVLALSVDGTLAAGCSGADGKVWVYDVEAGKELASLTAPGDQLRFLEFFPKGTTLAAGGKNGVIHLWDAKTGKAVGPGVGGILGPVTSVANLADGGAITAAGDGSIRVWDDKGKEVRKLEGHAGGVAALVMAADGKTAFTAGTDGTVRAWDVAAGKESRKVGVEKAVARSLALSSDGKTLAVGFAKGPIRVFEADTLKAATTLGDADAAGVVSLLFTPAGLVARDADHNLRVWDVAKAAELRQFAAATGNADAAGVALSPDGKTVASPLGSHRTEPKGVFKPKPAVDLGVWDAATGKLVETVQVGRRENELTAVAYLPDGKAVAVGDAAGIVWVIDLEKKAVRHIFKGHRGAVLCLAVAPDGKSVASGSADTTVLVWDVTDKAKPKP